MSKVALSERSNSWLNLQTATNFGLINQTYNTDSEYDPEHKKTQWQRFEHKVFRLNRQSGRNVQYKVLYMGRHGEGYHNAAESFYGTPAWNVRKAKFPEIELKADKNRMHSATGQKKMAMAPSPGPTPTWPKTASNKPKLQTPSGKKKSQPKRFLCRKPTTPVLSAAA